MLSPASNRRIKKRALNDSPQPLNGDRSDIRLDQRIGVIASRELAVMGRGPAFSFVAVKIEPNACHSRG